MKRILILGGGFAGVTCARTLRRALTRSEAEIVLFNAENHFVFTPLLADVIGASVNPLDVVVSLRHLLPGVSCRTESVTRVDAARNEIEYQSSDGRACRLGYDHLVLACGNVANLHAVPGMADHAFPLKNIADAIALRSHVMEQMEKAETCADPARRRWHLSFIIVGAGFSGVEAAGEINDLVRGSARYFQNFRAEDVTVTVLHSREQILPEIASGLRAFARRRMEQAGVRIRLQSRVASATAEGVSLEGGTFVAGATVVCTVGSSPAPIVQDLDAPRQGGRLVAEPDMRLRGAANLWAVGDCAHILNAHDGRPSPPTGQFAERQGRQCARNIVAALRGGPVRAFSFKTVGQLCSIGGHSAVAEFQGIQLSGRLAWLLWRGVYLFKLPAWARRLQVGMDWAWQLLFPRDLAHLRARQTHRVARAYDQPGDVVLRAGEAPANPDVPWRPEVHQALNGVAVRDLMDTVPQPLFKATSTLREIGRAFAEYNHELFYVCGEGQELEGVVTMTDWMRALSRGAGPETPATELMARHPVALCAEDTGAAAAGVVREHRLKHLPVVSCRGKRRLVGCLRTRRLMAHVFSRVERPLGRFTGAGEG